MEGYLQTNDLSVGYDGKALIQKVAFAVQRGRIVTLIGPNGSGKSTILKTIVGQLPRIGGTVLLDGGAAFACICCASGARVTKGLAIHGSSVDGVKPALETWIREVH